MLIFLGQNSIFSIIAFGVYLGINAAYGLKLDVVFPVVVFFDILSSFVPSTLPIYFNLNYSFSLARLRYQGISGTQLEKTVAGADAKIFCFDKTGTITEQEVNMKKIYSI